MILSRRTWKWWGLAAGIVLGAGDYAIFRALGIDMRLAGHDVTLLVCVQFAVAYAAFSYGIGALAEARARARADARTIREQLEALEAGRRRELQNEKLAAIGRLAAGLAHEVRNPLGVIRSSASMVQDSFAAQQDEHRACQFILEEIDRLNALITALLSFARPTPPRLRAVRLEPVLERALLLAAEELRRRGLRVEREDLVELPAVSADPDLLAQVLLGLLVNAAEALDEGGRIALRAGRAGAAGVYLEVADSGGGVERAEAERIFEPFFTTKPTGTGLGLPMAARIVHAHGGSIELLEGRGAGAAGTGACFRVTLPRAAADADGREAAAAGAAAEEARA